MYEPLYYLYCYGEHWLFKNASIEINNQPVSEDTELTTIPIIKTGTITEIDLKISDVGAKDYSFFGIRSTGVHFFKVNPKFNCSWLDGYYSLLSYYNQFDNTFTIRMKKIKTTGEDESAVMPFPAAPADYFVPEKKLYNYRPVLHGKYLPEKRTKIEKSVEFETEEEIFPEEIYQKYISKKEEHTVTIYECDALEQAYYKSLDKKTVVFNNQYVIVDASMSLRYSFLSKRNISLRLIGKGVYNGNSPNQFPECLGLIKYTNSYNSEKVNMLQYYLSNPDKNKIAEVLSEGNYHSFKLICSNGDLVKMSPNGLKISGTNSYEGYLLISMYNAFNFELKNNLLLCFDISGSTNVATLMYIQGIYAYLTIENNVYYISITGNGITNKYKVKKGKIYIAIKCSETKLSYIVYDGVTFNETKQYNKPSGAFYNSIIFPYTASNFIYFSYLAVMQSINQEMIKILDTAYYS